MDYKPTLFWDSRRLPNYLAKLDYGTTPIMSSQYVVYVRAIMLARVKGRATNAYLSPYCYYSL